MPSCEVVLKPLDGKVNFVSLPTAKRKTRFLAPLAIGTLLNLLVFCIMHFANDRTNMVRMCPFDSFLLHSSSQMPKLHEWLHAGALESRAGRNPLAGPSSLLFYYILIIILLLFF